MEFDSISMIGQRLCHYEIVAKIGEGGMGEIYRAVDTKLGREVALKLLPAEMATDGDRLERFRREARTVATLSHPSIVTVYSVEEDGDSHFLTMELVEGKPISELLPPEGFTLARILDLSRPIVDAVANAHEQGIVHRDLKPANVMVTDVGDRVKVLDFGLAKATVSTLAEDHSELPTLTQTQEGLIVGTPHYMSPEQARGETVDHRTDIFSLGVMLFEMATGDRPFQGRTPIELLSAVLKDAAPSMRESRAGLPGRLESIVERCMEKVPADRYATARDLLADLEGLKSDLSGGMEGEPDSWVPAPEAPASRGGHATELVGRSAERSELMRLLEQALGGRGGLVLLGGEPGVGKTRLAAELLDDGRARGMLALTGHAYEDESAPFVTVTEILEEVVRLLPRETLMEILEENVAELSRLMPDLSTLFPAVSTPVDIPPEQQQRHLFRSVLAFFARVSVDRPLVILLDDLHWADESSLLLLEHVAPRLRDLPILVIGTYRDVEADMGPAFSRTMAGLIRQRLASRLLVKPLDEASVADLLAVLGGPKPPPQLVRAIHRDTEGNVFFVEEVFRNLAEEGALFDADGVWRSDVDVEALDVPEGVRLVTGRRLERLDDETLDLLALAAVMGLRFRLRVLEAAASDGDAALDCIETAEAAQLIRPAEGGRELRYEFVHALVRQTLLSTVSPLRLQRLHLRVAGVIEEVDAKRLEVRAAELANHLVHAGASADRDKTVHWLRVAGVNAVSAAAIDEAVHYFDTALSLAEHPLERADLMHRRGSARLSLGHRDAFVADLSDAFDTFAKAGEGDRAAEVVSELSYMLVWNGRTSHAQTLIGGALTLLGEERSVARCRLLSARGMAHGMGCEPGEAEEAHTLAVELARSLDDPALLGEVLMNHALDRWFVVDAVGMERSGHEAAEIYRAASREWTLGQCLWIEQAGLTFQGRYDEAERINQELHPLAERNEDVGSLAISSMMNCLIQQARGNLEEAATAMLRSKELFEAGGFPWGWISAGHYSVLGLLMGENEKARAAFESAGANVIEGLSWSGGDSCYLMSGKARLGDGDSFEVYDSLRSSIPSHGKRVQGGPTLLLLGAIETLALLDRSEESAGLYAAIREIAESGQGVQAFTYGLFETFAGIAATTAREWGAAEQHFEKALSLAERLPNRVDQARVRYWYGRLLIARGEEGDESRAERLLEEARSLGESIGLKGLVAWVEDEMNRLRG